MGLPEDMNLLERNLDTLKHDFEQFFQGINKVPPNTLRTAVERLIRKYASTGINNAGHRFRYQNLVARYNSLNELWSRRMRMREEGIVIGAPQMYRSTPMPSPTHPSPPPDHDEAGQQGTERPVAAAATKPHQSREPGGKQVPGTAGVYSATTREPTQEAEIIKNLYTEYMRAQQTTAAGPKKISEDGFRTLIIKQVDAIKKSYDCQGVNFSIKVEDGDVKLKAKPVK